jgi:hypothetical protein
MQSVIGSYADAGIGLIVVNVPPFNFQGMARVSSEAEEGVDNVSGNE